VGAMLGLSTPLSMPLLLPPRPFPTLPSMPLLLPPTLLAATPTGDGVSEILSARAGANVRPGFRRNAPLGRLSPPPSVLRFSTIFDLTQFKSHNS